MSTTERPILFSGPMVRAILAGAKTQTRRVVKHQSDMEFDPGDPHYGPYWLAYAAGDLDGEDAKVRCPYGVPGDRLWVRETFAWLSDGTGCPDDADGVLYRATDPGWDDEQTGLRWRPSIFMPRAASRILLEITDVRVERLGEISEADARAEGVTDYTGKWWDGSPVVGGKWNAPTEAFRGLWESMNGPESWHPDRRVWVGSFRMVDGGVVA
jgi:hypothetical protein